MGMSPLPGAVPGRGPPLPLPHPRMGTASNTAGTQQGQFVLTPDDEVDKDEAPPATNAKVMGCNQGTIQLDPQYAYVMSSPSKAGYPGLYDDNTE